MSVMLTRGVDEIQSLVNDLGIVETMRSVGAVIAILVQTGEIETRNKLATPKTCLEDIEDGYQYVITKRKKS